MDVVVSDVEVVTVAVTGVVVTVVVLVVADVVVIVDEVEVVTTTTVVGAFVVDSTVDVVSDRGVVDTVEPVVRCTVTTGMATSVLLVVDVASVLVVVSDSREDVSGNNEAVDVETVIVTSVEGEDAREGMTVV